MVKILKMGKHSLLSLLAVICCPRHNQTLHFSSERVALWHPGTSLSTSSSLCVSKKINYLDTKNNFMGPGLVLNWVPCRGWGRDGVSQLSN